MLSVHITEGQVSVEPLGKAVCVRGRQEESESRERCSLRTWQLRAECMREEETAQPWLQKCVKVRERMEFGEQTLYALGEISVVS